MEFSQPFENLPCLLDATALSLDANLSMACQNLHPQRIANLAQVLIAAPQNRQLLRMALETDRDFWHTWPLAGPTGRQCPL